MKIEAPEIKKVIDDYDIVFTTGIVLSLNIDKEGGDTVEFTDDAIIVNRVSKPSTIDPTSTIPSEDLTIFKRDIAYISHRQHEVRELNPDQKEEWKKTLKDLIKPDTVH